MDNFIYFLLYQSMCRILASGKMPVVLEAMAKRAENKHNDLLRILTKFTFISDRVPLTRILIFDVFRALEHWKKLIILTISF